MTRLRLAVRSTAEERGFTLPELITTMAILLIVLSGITALFVSGSHAQADLTARFDAQTQLRTGVDKLRRDIHSACSWYSGATLTEGVPISSITLSLPGAVAGVNCSTTVTWCTQGSGTRYGLYKVSGATCTGGTEYADHLTGSTIFTYLAPGDYIDSGTGVLTTGADSVARLHVDATVDANTSIAGGAYHFVDDIAFPNSRGQ